MLQCIQWTVAQFNKQTKKRERETERELERKRENRFFKKKVLKVFNSYSQKKQGFLVTVTFNHITKQTSAALGIKQLVLSQIWTKNLTESLVSLEGMSSKNITVCVKNKSLRQLPTINFHSAQHHDITVLSKNTVSLSKNKDSTCLKLV